MMIVFKLKDEIKVKLGLDINTIAQTMDLPLIHYLKSNDHLLNLRSFISENEIELADQISHQHFETTNEYYSLRHFYFADFKEDVEDNILETILKYDEVQLAYIEPKTELCGSIVNRNQNRNAHIQNYLNPAPEGVGAEYAWQHLGSDGKQINVFDIEFGWKLDHQDLKTNGNPVPLIGNYNNPLAAYHGTAILGIIGARDNNENFIGLVPSANIFACGMENTANSLLNCIQIVKNGDIVVMPISPSDSPLLNFILINNLTNQKGVTTVVSAGNRETDLDLKRNESGKQIWNRNSPDFRDSGAIYVAACDNDISVSLTGNKVITHPRLHSDTVDLNNSAYGNRIDCYAWGIDVNTLAEQENLSTPFGGTSGASAIIAGVAAIVQGIAKSKNGNPFTPLQLRQILSDPNNGTASKNPNVDRIGVMPDLKKICENVFNLKPEMEINVQSSIKKRIIGLPIDKTLTLCREVGEKTYKFKVTSHIIEVIATLKCRNIVKPNLLLQHDVFPTNEMGNVTEVSSTHINNNEVQLILELDGTTNTNLETIQIAFRGRVLEVLDLSEMRQTQTDDYITNVYTPSDDYNQDKLICLNRPKKKGRDKIPSAKSDGPDWGGWIEKLINVIINFFKRILRIK